MNKMEYIYKYLYVDLLFILILHNLSVFLIFDYISYGIFFLLIFAKDINFNP